MSNKERMPVSFWLKDKTVTGLLVADHAGKKLVSYGGKYFVVTGKTPEKRHYTESSLPASWRKMMAGAAPPSPTSPKAGKTASVPVQQNFPSPGAREVDDLAQPAVRRPAKLREKAPPESAEVPKAPPESAKGKASPESANAPKGSPRGARERQATAKGGAAENEKVGFFCPYCSTEHACGADKAGAPFFQQCSKCGRDFGVKITARLVYQAEVAAFK